MGYIANLFNWGVNFISYYVGFGWARTNSTEALLTEEENELTGEQFTNLSDANELEKSEKERKDNAALVEYLTKLDGNAQLQTIGSLELKDLITIEKAIISVAANGQGDTSRLAFHAIIRNAIEQKQWETIKEWDEKQVRAELSKLDSIFEQPLLQHQLDLIRIQDEERLVSLRKRAAIRHENSDKSRLDLK